MFPHLFSDWRRFAFGLRVGLAADVKGKDLMLNGGGNNISLEGNNLSCQLSC